MARIGRLSTLAGRRTTPQSVRGALLEQPFTVSMYTTNRRQAHLPVESTRHMNGTRNILQFFCTC